MAICTSCEGTGEGSCATCGDGPTECACDDPEPTYCDECEGTGNVVDEASEEPNALITKRWSEYGYWKYSCGCVQYQDSSERCTAHRAGLPALVEQIFEEPLPKKLTAYVHVDGGAVPAYHTSGSVGLDVAASADTIVSPGETALVPLGIAVKPPEGHFFLMAARSSLFRRNLLVANGVGIIDPDFCGASDFISVPVYNFGTKDVWIRAGERIAQLVALPVARVVFEERQLKGESRGGFGSTGT